MTAQNVAPADRIDPNVVVPAAVRAAVDKTEALWKQTYAPPQEEAEAVAEESPAAEAPAPEPEASQPETRPQESRKQLTAEEWAHKYKSNEGRWERAEQTNRQLNARLEEMQRQMHAMQAQLQERQVEEERQSSYQKLITPEEENEYGAEFLEVVGKRAKEIAAQETADMKKELSELKARLMGVNNVVEQDAKERLKSELDRLVPEWRDMDTNEEFNEWLNLPDPYSGGIRRQLLHAAFFANNAQRVAAFFKGFLADEAATNPVNVGAAPVTSKGNKVPLETFAAPGRAKTAAASHAPAEKPTITRAQITAFYSAVQRGEYRNNEAEKDRIEQMIFSAQREGRVR